MADRGFAIPDQDEVAAFEARKKKAELEAEIEQVKKEYSEKMRKKAEKRKERDKDEKDKSKKDEKKEADEDKADEKERDEKVSIIFMEKHKSSLTSFQIKALEKGNGTPKTEDGPRIFSLHKYVD